MENKKIRANVELIKIDTDTKRPLKDADFELWNGEKLVGTYTTNQYGKILVENLAAGNYYWKGATRFLISAQHEKGGLNKLATTNYLTVGMKVVMLTETTGLILLHALIICRLSGYEARGSRQNNA